MVDFTFCVLEMEEIKHLHIPQEFQTCFECDAPAKNLFVGQVAEKTDLDRMESEIEAFFHDISDIVADPEAPETNFMMPSCDLHVLRPIQ